MQPGVLTLSLFLPGLRGCGGVDQSVDENWEN